MSKDGLLKKKMAICTILQRKFGCKCSTPGTGCLDEQPLFCTIVDELCVV